MTETIHSQTGKKSIFIVLFIISFSKISCRMFLPSEMKDVCSNSDDYINIFFLNDQSLNEKYKYYTPLINFDTKEDYIIKMLYLDNEAKNIYKSKKLKQFTTLKYVFLFLFLVSIFIILDLNIHFLFRNSYSEDNDNHRSIIKYLKISSFGWIRYLIYDTKKMEEFYSKYKRNELSKLNKFLKIFLIFISTILLLLSIYFSLYNNNEYEKSEKATNNLTCALMKLIYEIKNGPFREQKNFIGIDLIKSFYDNFDLIEKDIEKNIKIFNENYFISLNLTSQWEGYISNLNQVLSNKNSELVINSYPSDIDKIDDIEKYNKTNIYQLQIIYDYYPSNDTTKYLYSIDNNMHNKINSINELIKEIKNIFIPNSKIINLYSNSELIFKNIVQKFYKIFNIYINKFMEVYLKDLYEEFVNNYLSFLFNIDFAYLVLLALCSILFIPFIGYSYRKKCMENKLSLVVLLFNNLFILVILSIISSIKIISMKNKITYVDDLSKAFYFLLNKENQEYFIINDDFIINNEDYSIKDIDGTPKNIFYYINYLINNEKQIDELYKLSFSDFDNKQIDTLYEKIEISNYKNLDETNEDIEQYSKELKKIENEGLTAYTYFHDLTGNGFQGSGKECPSNYLTNINLITKYDKTKQYFSEFDCNEIWDIGKEFRNIDKYTYKKKQEIIINHYSSKDEKNPPLLNYSEFNIDEIIRRYDDLKKNNSKIYYQIINQFKALENFRENNIINKQLLKMKEYNDELSEINNNIINITKQNMNSSKNIIDLYKNIFKNYANNYDYSSFLDLSFIKTDINFVLTEIEEFILTINKCYKNHLIVNIINYILSITLVIYYSLISYEIPSIKTKTKTMSKSRTKINSVVECKQKIGYIMNGGTPFYGANIGGNVSIFNGGSTTNYNNLNAKYNTIYCGKDKETFNVDDLLSLNKEVGSKAEVFNKMATKDKKGSYDMSNDEKNEADNSKIGIIDRGNNDGNRILSKFNNKK